MDFAAGAERLTDDMVAAVGVLTDGVGALGSVELGVLAQQVSRMRAALERCALAISRRSAELHQREGAPDPEDLWGRHGGASRRDARDQRRRAKVCDDTPALGEAAQAGSVSGAHLDVIARLLDRLDSQLAGAFRALDDEITAMAQQLGVEDFEQWCRRRLTRLSAEVGRARHERQQRDTHLRRWTDISTGMYRLTGAFHPELGARLFAAIDAHINDLRAAGADPALLPGDPLGPLADQYDNRDHLAAHALARAVLAHTRTTKPARAEISVIVDAHTLLFGPHDDTVCEHTDGVPLPIDTLRRLACIADLHRVLWSADGDTVDLGRTTRLANRAQRRALRSRYRTCAWHGCDVPFHHCEIHHLHWWEHHGPTDLDNLLPLCVRHHHHAHELGWTLTLHPDRSLTIHQPDGTHWATTPPPTLQPTRARARARPPDTGPPDTGPPPDNTGPPHDDPSQHEQLRLVS